MRLLRRTRRKMKRTGLLAPGLVLSQVQTRVSVRNNNASSTSLINQARTVSTKHIKASAKQRGRVRRTTAEETLASHLVPNQGSFRATSWFLSAHPHTPTPLTTHPAWFCFFNCPPPLFFFLRPPPQGPPPFATPFSNSTRLSREGHHLVRRSRRLALAPHRESGVRTRDRSFLMGRRRKSQHQGPRSPH